MSDRVTVERKEFDGFLAENQKLMGRVDRLEGENKRLRGELGDTRTRLESIESNMGDDTREGDELLTKARETASRLATEADKRISKLNEGWPWLKLLPSHISSLRFYSRLHLGRYSEARDEMASIAHAPSWVSTVGGRRPTPKPQTPQSPSRRHVG